MIPSSLYVITRYIYIASHRVVNTCLKRQIAKFSSEVIVNYHMLLIPLIHEAQFSCKLQKYIIYIYIIIYPYYIKN